ncbi:MAG: aldo/keto reductase [Cyclobacteriaceae bacterium]
MDQFVTLNNSVQMPIFGLGVWQSKSGDETENAVRWAIETGYRHIDTAAFYQNETSVGKAIRDSGVSRDDLFVTTKLWNADQGYKTAHQAFERSLSKLGTGYIDLYLIHWPKGELSNQTWKAFEEIYATGKVKAIGVSNFMVSQLTDFLPSCDVTPAVNQVEFHPHLQQPELQEYCKKNKIQLEAWSPIMQGQVTDVEELKQIGNSHNKSPAQIALKWEIQKGIVTIPKSVKQHRIQENADIFDFELSDEEMTAIDNLDQNRRIGPDPLNFNF